MASDSELPTVELGKPRGKRLRRSFQGIDESNILHSKRSRRSLAAPQKWKEGNAKATGEMPKEEGPSVQMSGETGNGNPSYISFSQSQRERVLINPLVNSDNGVQDSKANDDEEAAQPGEVSSDDEFTSSEDNLRRRVIDSLHQTTPQPIFTSPQPTLNTPVIDSLHQNTPLLDITPHSCTLHFHFIMFQLLWDIQPQILIYHPASCQSEPLLFLPFSEMQVVLGQVGLLRLRSDLDPSKKGSHDC